MKRIDFIGTNGIGKSTTYHHLNQRRKRSRHKRWLTPREAKRRVAAADLLEQLTPTNLAKAATCYLPRMGPVLADTYTLRSAEKAFADDPGEYGEFFDHCLSHLMNSRKVSAARQASQVAAHGRGAARDFADGVEPVSRPPGYRGRTSQTVTPKHYVNLSWLFTQITELCLLESIDETVVFDESLAHSTVGLLTELSTDLAVRNHFEKMPVPQTLIYLTAPVDEIVRRIKIRRGDRGFPIVRYSRINEQQLRQRIRRSLRINQIGASTLEWRGARVLCLDAMEPPQENARKIEAFIDA